LCTLAALRARNDGRGSKNRHAAQRLGQRDAFAKHEAREQYRRHRLQRHDDRGMSGADPGQGRERQPECGRGDHAVADDLQ